MPNRATHASVGAGVSAGLAVAPLTHLQQSQALPELVGAMIGGYVGGILPDLLEPATSPNHRQMAHSLLAAAGLTFARVAEMQAACRGRADAHEQGAAGLPAGCSERNDAEVASMLWRLLAGTILGLVVGYASHLVLDASTSHGLPFLGELK
jgi:membrane-bound metal-dependent hydrolase YbcI (DUF457 family)